MNEEGKLHWMRLDRHNGATLVVKAEGEEKVWERFENGEGMGEVAKKLRRLAKKLDPPVTGMSMDFKAEDETGSMPDYYQHLRSKYWLGRNDW